MNVYKFLPVIVISVCTFVTHTSESIVGRDCKVSVSLNQSLQQNHTFDVNQLYSSFSDHTILTNTDQWFTINVCGSLTTRCNNQENVSVCLTHRYLGEMVIGRTNNSVVYDEGRLNFELYGDKCEDGKNSSVTIILKCDDSARHDDGPELLPSISNCTYYFIWYNRYSCTPHKEIDCSTMDTKNRIYDLSHLSLHSSNYVAIMQLSQGSQKVRVELNVCHSVIMGHDMTCKFDSGVCATDASNAANKTMRNLGDVSNGPYFDNDVLKLKYEGGDVCVDAIGFNTSTVIEFFCDHSKHDSHPTFLKLVHPCQYNFVWSTFAACPIELNSGGQTGETDDHIVNKGNNCIATDKSTRPESEFDLRPLSDKDYVIPINEKQALQLRLCGALQNSSCGANVSSCVVESNSTNYWSAGTPTPFFQQGNVGSGPLLYYTDGAMCTDNVTWSTLIIFDCGIKNNEGPIFRSIVGCKYVIHWYTSRVCRRQVQCVASSPTREVDLTALAGPEEGIFISAGTLDFLISVCQPLRKQEFVNCPMGAAICQVDKDANYVSLGYPVDSPVFDNNGDIVMTYVHGSECDNATVILFHTSQMRFVCDPAAGLGSPNFVETTAGGCTHHFEWRTSVACQSTGWLNVSASSADCWIYTSLRTLNLSSLSRPGGHVAASLTSNRNYSINLCGLSDTCDGAAVCEQLSDSWVSYGRINNVEYDFSDNYTKLSYSNGAPCDASGKSFYSAEVWLQCAENVGVGQPTVLWESDLCYVLFEWKTEIACGMDDLFSNHTEVYVNVKRKYSLHIGVQLAMIAALAVLCTLYLLWHFKVVRCPKCPRLRNRLSGVFRGEFSQVTYSRQRQEVDDEWTM